MSKKARVSLGIMGGLFALPTQFVFGYLLGLATPIAGLGAMAGIMYLFTGKVPFLSHTWPEEGDDRHLSLKLMPPADARNLFERERTRISADLNKMSTEIQAMAEQAQARAKSSVSKKG